MFNSSNDSINTIEQIQFAWYDYCIFCVMLGSSVVIGIYFGCFGKKQNSAQEYLLGGKNMKVLPIAISLVASHVSGITVLSIPADTYNFGFTYALCFFGILVTCPIASYVTMPVFHKLQVTSTYEYLEMRFNAQTRSMASLLFNIAMVLYLPIVIYGPALALAQATPINLHIVNPIICSVCIFYTTIGGLKTVVWTDTIQFGAMIAAIVAVLYVGIEAVGGMGTVFSRSLAGERLNLDFDVDLTNRDTFWALIIGWSIHWSSLVAINQGAVQKCLSLPSIEEVKKTMLIFAIGSIFCKAASVLTGLVMYAHYHDCDPFLLKRVSKSDQLLPYYIMDVANKIPGLPGLFIAGVFCAALSTLSANMNALSGTIYQDFVSRFVPKNITDEQVSKILKGIVIVIGVTSTTMVLVVEKLGGILPLSIAFAGITAGPLLGLFALGMLFPSANAKGALAGSISSLLFGSIMMVGNQLYQATGVFEYASKPASIEGCSNNITIFETNTITPNAEENVFMLFRISHYYYTLIGMLVVLGIGLSVSWFTGREKPVDRDLITPCMQWAIPTAENVKLYGVATAEELKMLNESISSPKIL